ncbi:MAG: TetR/AcrR family transcriptional regulator [Actinomycetota bacterium]
MTIQETSARRRPAQARSRERFERILEAAEQLIAERGLDPVTMTDVAAQAEMAVTAVYRYFPNKRAIVRELATRTMKSDTETLVERPPEDDHSAREVLRLGLVEYWRRHVEEPARIAVRNAVHSDAELSALDLAESRRNAASIAAGVAERTGRTHDERLERQALLFAELTDGLMRLASRVEPEEADHLIAEFADIFGSALTEPPDRE